MTDPATLSDAELIAQPHWIDWTPQPCPVPIGLQVAVYFADGRHLIREAGAFINGGEDWWQHQARNPRDGIVRYRVAATDAELCRAYQATSGEPGDAEADALLAEVERRGLDT